MGTAEVEGTVKTAEKTVWSSLTDEDCVAYEYKVEEKYPPPIDDWRIVEQDEDTVPFYVDDGTGEVLIDPEGAEILYTETRTESSEDNESTEEEPVSKKVWEELLESDKWYTTRRYTESYLPVSETVYVFGEAVRGKEAGYDRENRVIIEGDAPVFTVSKYREDELVGLRGQRAKYQTVGGAMLAVGGFLGTLLILA